MNLVHKCWRNRLDVFLCGRYWAGMASAVDPPRPKRTVASLPPGKPKRRRSVSPDAKAAREQEIIDAAYQAFLSKGYEQTSMAEIARGANIQGGTLYLYFSGKRELLYRIISRLYTQYIDDIGRGIAGVTNFKDKLRFIVRRDLRVYIEEPMLWRLIHEQVRTKPDYRGSSFEADADRLYAMIDQIITDGAAEGAVRSDLPAAAIRNLIVGALVSAGYRIIYGGEVIDIEAEADLITGLLLDGIDGSRDEPAKKLPDAQLNDAVSRLEALIDQLSPNRT